MSKWEVFVETDPDDRRQRVVSVRNEEKEVSLIIQTDFSQTVRDKKKLAEFVAQSLNQ